MKLSLQNPGTLKNIGVTKSSVLVFNTAGLESNEANLKTMTANHLGACADFLTEIKTHTDRAESTYKNLQSIGTAIELRANPKRNTIKAQLTNEIKRLSDELNKFAQHGDEDGTLIQSIYTLQKNIEDLDNILGEDDYEEQKTIANVISKESSTTRNNRQIFLNKAQELDKRSDMINNAYNTAIDESLKGRLKRFISTQY